MINGKPEIDYYGSKVWFLNGEYHRLDGPAVILTNGTKYWWVNGNRHRPDGPAIIHPDGTKQWWINDIQYTEDEFNNMILTRWRRLFS